MLATIAIERPDMEKYPSPSRSPASHATSTGRITGRYSPSNFHSSGTRSCTFAPPSAPRTARRRAPTRSGRRRGRWRDRPSTSALHHWRSEVNESVMPYTRTPMPDASWDDPELLRHVFERSEEHTSELQSRPHLVCRLLLA